MSRQKGTPVYLQLADHMRALLASGTLPEGARFPSARQVAAFLRVDRNSVTNAFKELESEGRITSRHGLGTFVAYPGPVGASDRPDAERRLVETVDSAIRRAVALGFSPAEFLSVAEARCAVIGPVISSRATVAVIACNRFDLEASSNEVRRKLGVSVHEILFEDIRRRSESAMALLARAQVLVTTFFHLDEVRAFAVGKDKRVVGVAAMEWVLALCRILSRPEGRTVAIVSHSEEAAANLTACARSVPHGRIQAFPATSADYHNLVRTLGRADLAVMPAGLARSLEERGEVPPGLEVVTIPESLDPVSLRLISAAVAEAGATREPLDARRGRVPSGPRFEISRRFRRIAGGSLVRR